MARSVAEDLSEPRARQPRDCDAPTPAVAAFRARYASLSDGAERPTGSLDRDQLDILGELPPSSPEERDAWWHALKERLHRRDAG